MFKNILTANQLKLLPLVREFSRDYYLAGGTAIALGDIISPEIGIMSPDIAPDIAILSGI